MRAIRVQAHGDPDVLDYAEVPDPDLGADEVLVRVTTAGVNYIDTYHRTGLYPTPLPFTPGVEGAGVVVSGPIAAGTRVAWTGPMGAYAELVAVPADQLVEVPTGVDDDTAAAVLLQGMTAHYLVTDTFALSQGDVCLIHAGAGGVGHLLIQMAKRLGATVFTTVGSGEKAEIARDLGADHVIPYRDVDFADEIQRIAGARPIDVVYDGVGAATFDGGMAVLRPRGVMVTFGNASGPVEAVSPLELARNGSLYLTRPTLGDHIRERADLDRRARDLFTWIEDGMAVRIDRRLPLADAAGAHRALEGRATKGKVLLHP